MVTRIDYLISKHDGILHGHASPPRLRLRAHERPLRPEARPVSAPADVALAGVRASREAQQREALQQREQLRVEGAVRRGAGVVQREQLDVAQRVRGVSGHNAHREAAGRRDGHHCRVGARLHQRRVPLVQHSASSR